MDVSQLSLCSLIEQVLEAIRASERGLASSPRLLEPQDVNGFVLKHGADVTEVGLCVKAVLDALLLL